MDWEWTSPRARPRYLFRVMHHKTPGYAENGNIVARDSDFTKVLEGYQGMRPFLDLVDAHRHSDYTRTPFISTFQDRSEADNWMFAASRFPQQDPASLAIAVVDLSIPRMNSVRLWRLKDIEEQTTPYKNPQGVYRNMRPLRQFADQRFRTQSEWFALWVIPAECIVAKIPFASIHRRRTQAGTHQQYPDLDLEFGLDPRYVPDLGNGPVASAPNPQRHDQAALRSQIRIVQPAVARLLKTVPTRRVMHNLDLRVQPQRRKDGDDEEWVDHAQPSKSRKAKTSFRKPVALRPTSRLIPKRIERRKRIRQQSPTPIEIDSEEDGPEECNLPLTAEEKRLGVTWKKFKAQEYREMEWNKFIPYKEQGISTLAAAALSARFQNLITNIRRTSSNPKCPEVRAMVNNELTRFQNPANLVQANKVLFEMLLKVHNAEGNGRYVYRRYEPTKASSVGVQGIMGASA
ncbi:hypothetical protein BJ875DRAFT_543638 [Amylocarpus encephaloides]|uniref:DUF7587 domain-containing protein n=1 Tax=Amylocarpus encephaloides TaxID=45428 RepID=A0A9P7YIH8_9HELO|nr:hypothetical protein BJ875DRAFT_543638 [Amylocarpus encephaloides]